MKYSIASLLVVMLLVAIAAIVWKRSQPLDHFEIVVSGHVASKFEPGIQMVIWSNDPSGAFPVVCDLEDLPLKLEKEELLGKGCFVSFYRPGQKSAILSVKLSEALFDAPRRIDIKLDEPKPVLRPFVGNGLQFRYSANVSQRMAYYELPYWDAKLGRLTACPQGPRLKITDNRSGKAIQNTEMTSGCMGSRWFCSLSQDAIVNDGDQLMFSANYDSGGLFNDTPVKFVFDYQTSLHH